MFAMFYMAPFVVLLSPSAPDAVVSSDLGRPRKRRLLGAGAGRDGRPVAGERDGRLDRAGRRRSCWPTRPALRRWREGLSEPPGRRELRRDARAGGAAVRDLVARGLGARWWSRTAARCGRRARSWRAAPWSLVPVPNACMTMIETDSGPDRGVRGAAAVGGPPRADA